MLLLAASFYRVSERDKRGQEAKRKISATFF